MTRHQTDHTDQRAPTSAANREDSSQRVRTSRERSLWLLATGITLAPIAITAVRAAWSGWVPAGDAAATVLRSRTALSANSTLLGMYTDASGWAGTTTYFPGPWHLWWMSLPIRVFGGIWGPILSMALLNALWIVLTGWIIRRHFGTSTAIGVLAFLGLLTWSLGAEAFYSPVPMVMIIPAFAALVFVGWAVASGDDKAIGWFALLVSFCLLDHLVLTTLVPIITLGAVALWSCGVVRQHRSGRLTARRRDSIRRGLVTAALVTVTMWAPTIVQQLTTTPGNVTNLVRAQANRPDSPTLWSRSLSVLGELFSPHRFWFAHHEMSVGPTAKHQIAEPLGSLQVAVFIGGSAIVVGLLAVAFRRRDRSAVTALLMVAISFGAALVNQARPPSQSSIRNSYFVSNRVIAMFVTFGVLFAVARLLPRGVRRICVVAAWGLIVVMALANLSTSHLLPGTTQSSPDEVRISRRLNEQLVPELRDRGLVAVGGDQSTGYPYALALAVALEDHSVPVCVTGIVQVAGAPIAGCPDSGVGITLTFTATHDASSVEPGWSRIAQANLRRDSRRPGQPTAARGSESGITVLALTSE